MIFYNNIGDAKTGNDGDPCSGLTLYDGTLYASTIGSLSPDMGIYNTGIFINSCNSFVDPLKSDFLAHNPGFYIGGKRDLPVGTAYTDQDFWTDLMYYNYPLPQALALAQQQTGIAGQGYYDMVSSD